MYYSFCFPIIQLSLLHGLKRVLCALRFLRSYFLPAHEYRLTYCSHMCNHNARQTKGKCKDKGENKRRNGGKDWLHSGHQSYAQSAKNRVRSSIVLFIIAKFLFDPEQAHCPTTTASAFRYAPCVLHCAPTQDGNCESYFLNYSSWIGHLAAPLINIWLSFHRICGTI